jgi:hypothetical protein
MGFLKPIMMIIIGIRPSKLRTNKNGGIMGIQYPPIIKHEGPLGNPRIMPGCFGGKIIKLNG